MQKEEGELSIVTEVGVFGGLNMEDPTKKKVQKLSDIDDVIREAIETNSKNL